MNESEQSQIPQFIWREDSAHDQAALEIAVDVGKVRLAGRELRQRIIECELRTLRNQVANLQKMNDEMALYIVEMNKRRRSRGRLLDAKRARRNYALKVKAASIPAIGS